MKNRPLTPANLVLAADDALGALDINHEFACWGFDNEAYAIARVVRGRIVQNPTHRAIQTYIDIVHMILEKKYLLKYPYLAPFLRLYAMPYPEDQPIEKIGEFPNYRPGKKLDPSTLKK